MTRKIGNWMEVLSEEVEMLYWESETTELRETTIVPDILKVNLFLYGVMLIYIQIKVERFGENTSKRLLIYMIFKMEG